MVVHPPDFCGLLQRVRQGCAQATQMLIDHYQPYLLAAVQRWWNRRLRPVHDPADITQQIWLVFFSLELPRRSFPSGEELWRFLAALAQNHAIDALRHCTCKKRGGHALRSLDQLGPEEQDQLEDWQPGPVRVACAREEWGCVAAGLSEQWQRILVLRGEGFTYAEIGRELAVSEMTVRRVLQRASGMMPA